MASETKPPATKRPTGWGWLAWRVIRIPLIAYLGILLLFATFENSLIFFPSKHPAGDWQPRSISFEDAQFAAADGTEIHGWYVEANEPSAVILFCHGNAGNITDRIDLLQAMQTNIGATILAFDYRGYGRSAGVPTEAGCLQDARAARKWLSERAKIREADVVILGESLGGAVAVQLAAQDGARGLILEDTFTSLPDMAGYHYPWLPARWLMRNRFDSLKAIPNYHGPLLMNHGSSDTIVPYRYAEQLFAAANEPKQLVTDEGFDHNDPRSERFYAELRRFLQELPK